MYLLNKYTSWYYSIIDRASSRILPDDTYTEMHHIIPKSLGGSNKLDNLVKLTAREHYICHRLLPKMTVGNFRKKMVYALWCIVNVKNNNQLRYKITSRQYDLIKLEQSSIRKTYKHTDESRRKISIGNKGKIVTIESRYRMSQSAIIRGNTNTPEAIVKSKETRKKNGTENSLNSSESIAKRINSRKENGNWFNGAIASHTPEVNAKRAKSLRKSYVIITPTGEQIQVDNLKEFCKIHDLNYDRMNAVANNYRKHYNFWVCRHTD
jgi:hypothetical protein